MRAGDDVRVFPDLGLLGEAAAGALTQILAELTQDRSPAEGPIELAVAGGFVATDVLSRVDAAPAPGGDHAGRPRPAWDRVRVWWADERYVPASDPDRNDTSAFDALFTRTAGVDLRPMPVDDGTRALSEAGRTYRDEWTREMSGRRLDLAVLGMGPDGHVASLFPGRATLDAAEPVLVEPDSPKPPPPRITLSRGVLTGARRIWVVAGGGAKADALARAFAPGADFHEVPAAALRGPRTTWWLDRDAAARLPG